MSFTFHSNTRRLASLLGTAAVLAASLPASLPAYAGPYTQMVVFGDSLSDTGNLSILTGGAQPPAGQPYFNGRFSDGPLWVETLATGLGLTGNANPFLVGGNNYAFAGARSGTGNAPPGLLAQVGGIWGPGHATADANALYVVVAGGNDLRDARSALGNTAATRQAAAAAAANNVFTAVGALAAKGAKHVLISNLPDLGATPEAALLGVTAASTDVTDRFNLILSTFESILEGAFAGLDVDFLDMAGIGAAVRADALQNGGATYGITNAVAPCAGFAFSNGASCAVSLFSDVLHPSARAHQLLGEAALRLVPEPGTPMLALLALSALLLVRRQQARV